MKGDRLRAKRDKLWKEFNRMPRRSSFSGIHVANQLDAVQKKLDKLEGDKPSKRYHAEITVEMG